MNLSNKKTPDRNVGRYEFFTMNSELTTTNKIFLPIGEENFIPGSDLLSHPVARAVPSTRRGLTAVFGKGTGVSPSL
jgi:hypothetical protein